MPPIARAQSGPVPARVPPHVLSNCYVRVIRIGTVVFQLARIQVLMQRVQFAFTPRHTGVDYIAGTEDIDIAEGHFNGSGHTAFFRQLLDHFPQIGVFVHRTRRQNRDMCAVITVGRKVQTEPVEEFSKRAGDISHKRKLTQRAPTPCVTKHF